MYINIYYLRGIIMRKCEICGKEVSRINLVKVAEFETMQMCDDCIEDEEVVQIIDDDDDIIDEVLRSIRG